MLCVSGGHSSSGVTVGNEDAPGGWSAGGYCVCVCVEHVCQKTRGKDIQGFTHFSPVCLCPSMKSLV